MVQDELATGSLDDPSPVGGGVVGGSLSEGDTLSHLREGQRSAGRRKAFFAAWWTSVDMIGMNEVRKMELAAIF